MKVTNRDQAKIKTANKVVQNTHTKKKQSYTMQNFGKRLIELRNENKLSQQQSADLIGISRNTLSMYERGERCASIDVAVNAANKYNVTLDYLFGNGYKSKEYNDMGIYELGFSETSLDMLSDSNVLHFVDAILSDPRSQKLADLIYSTHYKPFINSYEVNYLSRLAADLLYAMIVDVNKDAYQLRPMTEDEMYELNDAIKQCIRDIESQDHLLRTDYDSFVDCEDNAITELERIKILLEHSESYSLEDARAEGFQNALKMIAKGDILVPNGLSENNQMRLKKPLETTEKK